MKTPVRLLAAVVIPVLLVSALLYPIFSLHLEDRIDRSRDAGRALLEAEYEGFVRNLNESLNHALAIAEFPSLHRLLDDTRQPLSAPQALIFERERARRTSLFNTLLTHFGRYTRLSLIDLRAKERLSALRPVRSVKSEHLGADYFEEAMVLPPRGIYVSRPYIGTSLAGPEIRTTLIDLAVPVFSEENRRLGVLLVTLDWRHLMAGLPHRMEGDDSMKVFLVDAQGVSLMPGSESPTAFGESVADQWPKAWNAMIGHHQGELITSDQMVMFRNHDIRVHHNRSQAEQVVSDSQSQPWRLGIVLNLPYLGQQLKNQPMQMVVLGLVYALAVGFGIVWVFSHDHQKSLRRHAELLSSEARQYSRELHDLYENAPCGYHSLDDDGRIVKMNRTELSWLGISRDDAIGKLFYRELVTPESRKEFDRAFDAVLNEGHEGSAECELICRDGSTLPVAIEATAQITEEGFQYSRAMVFDLTERKQLEELLLRQSLTDPLTSLGNRRFLGEQARLEMARSERSGEPLSLIAMDLDHFKGINDSHGHDVGDCVLKAFATTALSQLREGDVLCRVGGEEFTALLPNTSERQAMAIAERLRQAVETNAVDVGQESPLTYTASLGVASIRPGSDDMEGAVKRADEALYQAKRGGRNQVWLWRAAS